MVPVRIDSHQHFWVYHPGEFPWIGADMSVLARDCMPADLEPHLRRMRMNGSIAVQARQTVDETEFLLSLAQSFPFILGVVGWVDLRSQRMKQQLERMAASSKLRGVRHVVQNEPDPGFLAQADFLRGMRTLSEFGLVYDLLIRPGQLPAATELAARFPRQSFVLDHLAKPPIRSGALDPWRSQIRHLAAMENVACKISGMVTEAHWNSWKPEQFTAYLEIVLEAFGSRRLMIGSDWPVCTVAATYEQVLEAAGAFIARLSPCEQQDVWGVTAARIYGLPGERCEAV